MILIIVDLYNSIGLTDNVNNIKYKYRNSFEITI